MDNLTRLILRASSRPRRFSHLYQPRVDYRIRHRSSLFKRIPRINATNDARSRAARSMNENHRKGKETEEWARVKRRIRHVSVSPTPSSTTRVKRAACRSNRNWDIIGKIERFSANLGGFASPHAREAVATCCSLAQQIRYLWHFAGRLEELASQ